MKRILGQSLSLFAIVALGSIFTPACADDDGSIFVLNALGAPLSRQSGTCTYTPDPTQPFLSQGTLDTGLASAYGVRLLIANQLLQRGDPTAPRSESSRFHIEGAVVRVTDANGGAIADFTSVTSGFADSANGTSPGYGIADVTALDANTVGKIGVNEAKPAQRLVLANMKVFGKTIGGLDIETAEFSFPITVCYGCLVDFSVGDDPATTARDCTNTATVTGSLTQQQAPCTRGQDETVPCQICKSFAVCN